MLNFDCRTAINYTRSHMPARPAKEFEVNFFKPATNTQARLKAGIMGFAGDGKTYTASTIAIGLVQLMRKRELAEGDKPVMFLDTETGSDWVKPRFDAAGIQLMTAKTRAFTALLECVKEAEESGCVLLIDSITHFWRDLTESYAKKKGRNSLKFEDWSVLKTEWGKFTDAFVNANCHAILCGRAGYEYDFFENDAGKKELEKTGIKMKAEGETGYEPSILVLMQKHRDMETNKVWREAHIIKDRSTRLDGKTFINPTFDDFMPHIDFLNLAGKQFSVDTQTDSQELFQSDGRPRWKWEAEQKEIALDEIAELLSKHHPGSSAEAKKTRADLVEKHAGTRSWERIKTFPWLQIKELRGALWLSLEGSEYGLVAGSAGQSAADADVADAA